MYCQVCFSKFFHMFTGNTFLIMHCYIVNRYSHHVHRALFCVQPFYFVNDHPFSTWRELVTMRTLLVHCHNARSLNVVFTGNQALPKAMFFFFYILWGLYCNGCFGRYILVRLQDLFVSNCQVNFLISAFFQKFLILNWFIVYVSVSFLDFIFMSLFHKWCELDLAE